MAFHIPNLKEGSYFPQAYVDGVATRRVDDLVKTPGCEGISTSPEAVELLAEIEPDNRQYLLQGNTVVKVIAYSFEDLV